MRKLSAFASTIFTLFFVSSCEKRNIYMVNFAALDNAIWQKIAEVDAHGQEIPYTGPIQKYYRKDFGQYPDNRGVLHRYDSIMVSVDGKFILRDRRKSSIMVRKFVSDIVTYGGVSLFLDYTNKMENGYPVIYLSRVSKDSISKNKFDKYRMLGPWSLNN